MDLEFELEYINVKNNKLYYNVKRKGLIVGLLILDDIYVQKKKDNMKLY